MIANLVTDQNGGSLMTQTSDGWTFNMSNINNNLNTINQYMADTDTYKNNNDSIRKQLSDLINDVAKNTAYITMATDEIGAPCIELGRTETELLGGRNLILKSGTFEKSSEYWSINSAWTVVNGNGYTEITCSRTGATSALWYRAIPHKYLTLADINSAKDGIYVSFDLKVDDISALDQGVICALQSFKSDGTRLGWYETANIITGVQYDEPISSFSNGVWKRAKVHFSQSNLKPIGVSDATADDIAYTSISTC